MKKTFKMLNFVRKLIINVLIFIIAIYALIVSPILFGFTPLVIDSGSMEPNFHKWSIIYYESVQPEEIKVNDVIVFKYNNVKNDNIEESYIMHRIVNIENNKIYTKGDANKEQDEKSISYNNLEGRIVSFNIPYLGKYILYLQNHEYLISIIVILLLSDFLISNVYVYVKNKKDGGSFEKTN